jgi:hypothetical protein
VAVRFGGAVALAGVCGLLLSGCGNSQESSVQVIEAGVFARSAEATSSMKSARFEFQETKLDGGVSTQVVGSVDLVTNRVAATSTIKISLEASEPLDPSTSAAFNGPTEYVMTGDTVFLRGGSGVALLRDKTSESLETLQRKWLRIDTTRLGEKWNADFQSSFAEPEKLWQRIALVSSEPQKVGEEQIRGVPTTHWKAATSLAALAELAEKTGTENTLDVTKLGTLANERVVLFEVWIDKLGRIRRETESIDVDAAMAAWKRDRPATTTAPSTATPPTSRGQFPDVSRLLSKPEFADALAESALRHALEMTSTWEVYDIDQPVQIDLPQDAVDITDQINKPGK